MCRVLYDQVRVLKESIKLTVRLIDMYIETLLHRICEVEVLMWNLKSIEDVEDFVLGATVLGTGGGGDPEEGLKLLREALKLRGRIDIVKLEELDRNSTVVVPYYVGTIAPTAKTKKPIKISEPVEKAFEIMEETLGVKIKAVVASEIGGFNTPIAMYISAKLGLPIVDGDLLGRAAPELHQCTVHIFDIPMYPSVIVSETGNIILVKEYSDIDDYEAIARYLSVLAGRFVAVVDTPLKLEEAEKAVVKESLTLCYNVGRAVRNARREGRNPIEAVVEALKGWKIFEGEIVEYKWRDESGFLVGEVIVEGLGNWSGRKFKSWIKNEHIIGWIDDKPAVMPPDLIAFLRDDGEPLTNTVLKEGMKVNVVACKAPEVWRCKRGLELFGPRHFGFNLDYTPVEELVKKFEV